MTGVQTCALPIYVSVITEEDLQKSGQSTLVEVLRTQPGLEVTSNGGMGATSNVFIRGANNNHTVVLVDGIRLSSATLGTTAFENIPVSQIEHIEILRGAGSSLYGADAVGGVIQIFTKRGEGALRPNLSVGAGSYNTQSASVGYGGRVNDTSFNLQFGYIGTAGFSAIGNSTNSTYNPDSDGYRNNNLTGTVSQTLAPGHEIGFTLLNSSGFTHFDSGGNTPAANPTHNFDYRLSQNLTEAALYSKNRFTANWESLFRIGAGLDHSTSFAPNTTNTITTLSAFRTNQNQATWQNDINIGPALLTLGAEKRIQKVGGSTNYAVNERDVNSAFGQYQQRFDKHKIQLNARNDNNSQFGSRNTGSISYGYQLTSNLRVSATTGTAFNAPTFNQLYFPGFGNANLRPERASSREASATYNFGLHRVSVVYYDTSVTDLIVNAGVPLAPSNVNRAKLNGTTLSYLGDISGNSISASADFQDPRDEASGLMLPRRSRQHATLSISRDVAQWRLGSELAASTKRYDDAANTKSLGGYGLVNLTASYLVSKEVTLIARANNVFNKQYELIKDFNTPGANVFVGLQYQPRRGL